MNWGFKDELYSGINEIKRRHPSQNVSPVSGLQAIQSVVISLVQGSLCCPVDKSLGKKLCEDVVEPGDRCHVQGKTITGHPADHPGPLACAEKRLSERVYDWLVVSVFLSLVSGPLVLCQTTMKLFYSSSVLPSLQIY